MTLSWHRALALAEHMHRFHPHCVSIISLPIKKLKSFSLKKPYFSILITIHWWQMFNCQIKNSAGVAPGLFACKSSVYAGLRRKAELGTGLNIIFANFASRTTTKQYHVAIIAL